MHTFLMLSLLNINLRKVKGIRNGSANPWMKNVLIVEGIRQRVWRIGDMLHFLLGKGFSAIALVDVHNDHTMLVLISWTSVLTLL